MFMFQSHFIEMQIPSNITLGALEHGFRTLFQIKQRIVVTAYARGHDCIQTVEISTDAALKRFLTANDSVFLFSGLLYITTNEWHCVNPSPILIRADPRLSVWTGVKDNIPAAIATQCRGFSGKPSITGTVNIVGDSRSRRDIVDLLRLMVMSIHLKTNIVLTSSRHSLKDVVPMVVFALIFIWTVDTTDEYSTIATKNKTGASMFLLETPMPPSYRFVSQKHATYLAAYCLLDTIFRLRAPIA